MLLQLSLSLSLSLCASPSFFLSLFLLLIDLQPQRIKSHPLKTPLSCATDSKSHRENTYRKRPEKSLWRIISQVNCRRKLQRYVTNSFSLCLSLLASPVCFFSQWSNILLCRCCNCCRLSQQLLYMLPSFAIFFSLLFLSLFLSLSVSPLSLLGFLFFARKIIFVSKSTIVVVLSTTPASVSFFAVVFLLFFLLLLLRQDFLKKKQNVFSFFFSFLQ